jgi:hypothetical protein
MHIPRTQSKDRSYQLGFALCWICMPWLGILLDPDFLFDDAPSRDTQPQVYIRPPAANFRNRRRYLQ